MSTPSWQDLLDEEDGPVRADAPAAPTGPAPSAPARERASSLEAAASLVDDPELTALLAEQQALEQQILAMGQPASVALPSGYALPEETADSRLAARKAERARVEARLEERHTSAKAQHADEHELARRRRSRAEALAALAWEAGRDRSRVGSAGWRLESREPGTAAWAWSTAREEEAWLEARTLPENRPAATEADTLPLRSSTRPAEPQEREPAPPPPSPRVRDTRPRALDAGSTRPSRRVLEDPPLRGRKLAGDPPLRTTDAPAPVPMLRSRRRRSAAPQPSPPARTRKRQEDPPLRRKHASPEPPVRARSTRGRAESRPADPPLRSRRARSDDRDALRDRRRAQRRLSLDD